MDAPSMKLESTSAPHTKLILVGCFCALERSLGLHCVVRELRARRQKHRLEFNGMLGRSDPLSPPYVSRASLYARHRFCTTCQPYWHAIDRCLTATTFWLRHYLGKGWFDYKRKHKAKQHPSDYIFSKADEASAAGIREQTQH